MNREPKAPRRGRPSALAALGASTFERGLGLALVVFAAFAPALRGGFLWDDDANVTENETLRSAAGLARIWTDVHANQQYYPLTHTSFWLEVRLFGLSPFGFHLDNLVLHAAGALLLWRALVRLEVAWAWLAAALFAVHPLQVESVAWVTERKNVLSGALAFGALLAFLRFADVGPRDARAPSTPSSRRRAYAAALGLFIAALLAKSATLVLAPVLVVLLAWKKRPRSLRALAPTAPFLALGAAAGALTAWLERAHVGATYTAPLADRVLVAGRAFWFYVGKALWPADLVFIYPRWHVDTASPAQLAAPLAVVALYAALWRLRGRLGDGPLVGALCYGLAIAPALGLANVYFHVYSYVQDHFQYFAGPAVVALAVSTASLVARRPGLDRPTRAVAAAALAAMVVVDWGRCALFRDDAALFGHTLEHTKDAWLAHYNLARHAHAEGRVADAIAGYRAAAAANPGLVEARVNLGGLLAEAGRTDEAVAALREATRAAPDDPIPLMTLASVLERAGRAAEAAEALRGALAAEPGWVEAELRLAALLATAEDARVRDGAGAVALATAACEHGGPTAACLDALAAGYAESGRFEEATATAARAAALAPARGGAPSRAAIEARRALYAAGRAVRGR